MNDHIVGRSYRIYVDETGLETWQGHTLFGFAGVAGFGSEIFRADRSWKQMKREHFGKAELPLHASRDALTDKQIDAISTFFSTGFLRRFAYICLAPPLALPGLDALRAMQDFLLNELMDHILQLPKLPIDVAVVFEASDRLSPKIMESFPGLSFTVEAPGEADDGAERHIVRGFADKSLGLAALEMADQIAYRAQREVRRALPITDPTPEFLAIFPKNRTPHARFVIMDVTEVKYESSGVSYTFREPGKVRLHFEGQEGMKAANRWLAQMSREQADQVLGWSGLGGDDKR
ncbi:MAG: hypothetical protein AB1760_11150 [Pseudomonadota bacterium]